MAINKKVIKEIRQIRSEFALVFSARSNREREHLNELYSGLSIAPRTEKPMQIHCRFAVFLL